MKKIFLTLCLVWALTPMRAQLNWSVDMRHSQIQFSVLHMMITNTEGVFTQFSGTVQSKDVTFNDAKINFVVETKSVDTRDGDRDNHLRSGEFFDVNKYPQMVFKSTSFKKVAGKKYKLVGDLTIKDVTKQVTFDVTFNGVATDGFGNKKAGFKATTTINRMVYGLMWNKVLEGGSLTVSNEVEITVNLELLLK